MKSFAFFFFGFLLGLGLLNVLKLLYKKYVEPVQAHMLTEAIAVIDFYSRLDVTSYEGPCLGDVARKFKEKWRLDEETPKETKND